MIFLGDLACPPEKADDFNKAIESLDILSGHTVVLNFEAVIPFGQNIKPETLYNHESALNGLQQKARKIIVSLANNHMYDYPEAIIPTKEYLEKRGIGVFGLLDSDGNICPYEFDEGNDSIALFGHCWNLYSASNPNRINKERIVDCDYMDFINTIKAYIKLHPNRIIYCFMHWNYDLEQYPFPMHVKLSRDLIDAGVYGVIGSHSHVAHCVELYKNRPIAYCLGNFYLPSGVYFDGKLIYPENSKHTIGIRVDKEQSEVLCFQTDCEIPVRFEKSLPVVEYSPFPNTDIESYVAVFRKNRKKRFLVPIFDSYVGCMYKLKNQWAILRIKIIKKIFKLFH